jgi:hypothetical protein
MNGPFPVGTYADVPLPTQWSWENNRLIRGMEYRVTKSFIDGDGNEHLPGEEWCFIGSSFSAYYEKLGICIRSKSNEEWNFSLYWRPDGQEEIAENFLNYVIPI